MNGTLRATLVAATALALGACASTFSATWKNPEAGAIGFSRGDTVVAMLVTANEGTRRMGEDALVRAIDGRGLKGVPSYTVLTAALAQDPARAKAAVAQAGAAAVVVMRVLGKDQVTATQMSRSVSYTAYWDGASGWSTPYNPSDMRGDTVLVVETLVYDVRQDKLVWSGRSEATNPKRIDALVAELANATAAQLRKEGLVK
jgi:hypothetical protein